MAKETPAEKAKRLASRSAVPAATTTPEEAPARREVRPNIGTVKPVRITLDLAPALYEELEGVTEKLARELGTRRQFRPELLRVLIRELIDNPEVQARAREQLRASLAR